MKCAIPELERVKLEVEIHKFSFTRLENMFHFIKANFDIIYLTSSKFYL